MAFDAEARYAQLEERVQNQGRDLARSQAEVQRAFADIREAVASLGAELRNNAVEFKNSQRPQWAAVGVALSFAAMVGALAYWPVREAQADLKSQFGELRREALSVDAFKDYKATTENFRLVARQDYEARFARIDAEIRAFNAAIVPRGEHEGHWRTIATQITDLQRQIDATGKLYGDAYSLRDFVKDLQARLDRIERDKQFIK